MHDYRRLIVPFINSRRTDRTLDSTIRKDTKTLNEGIDFLEHGDFDAPNEAYFEALENHFLESLAKSTTDSRISLTRKFFTWTQKGDGHMQEDLQITKPEQSEVLADNIETSNEEAHSLNFSEGHEETLEASHEPENPPSFSTVDADTKQPMPPQNRGEGAGLDTEHKSSKQIKLTVYPDKALEADIRDLAALLGLPVSKFILTLIQQEVNNRRDDLNVIRSLRAKRA